jgi:hypothetical protein
MVFTKEFKRQVVEEILSGGTTNTIAYQGIARWKMAQQARNSKPAM